MNESILLQKPSWGRLTPAQITACYIIVGVLWVVATDYLLATWIGDVVTLSRFHTLKSWIFVLATAAMLYILMQRSMAALYRSEQLLREKHGLLNAVIEGATDAIFIKDAQGRYILVNTACAQVFEKTPAEVISQDDAGLFSPDTAQQVREQDRQIMTSGKAQTFETRATTAGGKRRSYSTTKTPYRDDHGHIIGVIGIARDITEQKRTEEQLQDSEARFRELAEKTRALPWVADARTWRFTYVGPQATDLLGYSPEDWYQDGFWAEHLHPDHRDWVTEYCAKRSVSEDNYEFEYRMVSAQGNTIWLHDIVNVVRDDQGPSLLRGYMIDITARKQAEETLRQQAEQLAEADHRKDEFLAMLAHELRNPLAPIRSAVELLRLQGPMDPKLQWATEVIGRQASHLTHLVNDLLEVARITRGKIQLQKQSIDLAEVISHAVEAVRALIDERQHELTLSLPAMPIRLEADPTRLEQVIVNLLSNAAKYTERGGHIDLSVRRQQGEAVITVRDTGIGIPVEMLPHVFDLFTQADRSLDRSRGGLGIGLPLVRRLVEMHGGSILASSKGPGTGSEFVVRLPILTDVQPPTDSTGRPSEFTPGLIRRRILVVDDNEDVVKSLAMLFTAKGYETHTASDGPAALEAVHNFQPEVVFLDIGLPGMDGYEVARRLREDYRQNMMLVALTGYGQEQDIRRAKEAGFDYHLLKPVGWKDIEAVLASYSSISPSAPHLEVNNSA